MKIFSHVVIGIFEGEFDSVEAVDVLLEHGFSRDNIHLSDRGNFNRSFITHQDDGHASRVMQFFRTVFSDDKEEAERYARVALESSSLIMVYAHSMEEAEKASKLMDENGAMQVPSTRPDHGHTGTVQKSRIVECTKEEAARLDELRLDATSFW